MNKKARSRTSKPSAATRVYTYDRDIICLPRTYADDEGLVKIPRQRSAREFLAVNKLIGKIRLSSAMTEDKIMEEIRSVFRTPMDEDSRFPFQILQSSGGSSKSLTIPVLSASYQWTAGAVAGKNSKTPIYILAEDKLKVCMH